MQIAKSSTFEIQQGIGFDQKLLSIQLIISSSQFMFHVEQTSLTLKMEYN